MSDFSDTDRFELRDDLVVEEIDDEIVVLDLEGNQYFGLNEVGWLIWRAIEEDDAALADIVDRIVDGFDVDADTAREDTKAFIGQLLEADLADRAGEST